MCLPVGSRLISPISSSLGEHSKQNRDGISSGSQQSVPHPIQSETRFLLEFSTVLRNDTAISQTKDTSEKCSYCCVLPASRHFAGDTRRVHEWPNGVSPRCDSPRRFGCRVTHHHFRNTTEGTPVRCTPSYYHRHPLNPSLEIQTF